MPKNTNSVFPINELTIKDSPEVRKTKHSRRKKTAAGIVMAGLLSAGVGTGRSVIDSANQAKKYAKLAAASADYALSQSYENDIYLSGKVVEAQKALDYLGGITGLTKEQLSAHLQYPEIPHVPIGAISREIAEKQDKATLYLFKHDTSINNDPNMPLSYHCTVIKTGPDTLNTATHCFKDYIEPEYDTSSGAQGRGAGDVPVNAIGYVGNSEFYVSNKPYITLAEAQESAMLVIGFGQNYSNTDAAKLQVSPSNADSNWFSQIEPLTALQEAPAVGSYVRVAGYPNGSANPVAAEGMVLGRVPSSLYNSIVNTELLMVGIRAEDYSPSVCSFGGSGETIVGESGGWWGQLSQVSRSFNPIPPDMTPEIKLLTAFESALETKLSGTNYILCAMSDSDPNIQLKPYVADPNIILGK